MPEKKPPPKVVMGPMLMPDGSPAPPEVVEAVRTRMGREIDRITSGWIVRTWPPAALPLVERALKGDDGEELWRLLRRASIGQVTDPERERIMELLNPEG